MVFPPGGHGFFILMKQAAISVMILLLFSCIPREEIHHPVKAFPQPPAADLSPGAPAAQPSAPAEEFRPAISCREQSAEVINRSGIEMLSFIRPVFFDIDRDGSEELIAGSKDGQLRLYKENPPRGNGDWKPVADYFSGIAAGAFSAPAAGDIDNDGVPEIAVGTGGFSADSGRVLFYRNTGSPAAPVWVKVQMQDIRVGNDATPVLFDIDQDRKPDLVVGNSQGRLILFRNRTKGRSVRFVRDSSFFQGIELGMYSVPSVVSHGGNIIIIAGNSLGRLYLLRKNGSSHWEKHALDISVKSFATPSFISSGSAAKDMVLADGDGRLSYFRNRLGTYEEWEQRTGFFTGRVITGLACTPSVTLIEDRTVMVVGNINGEIRLFEQTAEGGGWTEKEDFFRNIRLSGFSRGILAKWQGRHLLISGQHDGVLRAFLNWGSWDRPLWTEQRFFFEGIPVMQHAAPTVFDLDGDGRWELVVGDAEGHVRGFRYDISDDGKISWSPVPKMFDLVKVRRFAMPSLFRDAEKTYLLAGQQDGRITVFTLELFAGSIRLFLRDDFLADIRTGSHSSPSVIMRNGIIELSVGDYDGNLVHYTCRKELIPIN